MNRTSTVLTVAAVSAAGLLAYAAYFDYKRRNDAAFRKKLRKEKKKISKTVAQSAVLSKPAGGSIEEADIQAVLDKIKEEALPSAPEEKEAFFMNQVNLGEQLCLQGPEYYLPAAMCFYRALRVYPSPVELIVIYEKTMPEPVFKLVVAMTNLDVKNRIAGYYDHFPPKSMYVSTKFVQVPDGNGAIVSKRIIVVNKDFKAGDIIYKEQPLVTVLDADLEGKGEYCSHCLRHINKNLAIRPEKDLLESAYCSKECQINSNVQSHNLLFDSDPSLPPELMQGQTQEAPAERRQSQEAYVGYIRGSEFSSPLLVARFIARQVGHELAKMAPQKAEASTLNDSEYSLYDHMERLRYLEAEVASDETKLLVKLFQTVLPGLEQFITDERHATLKGKMLYNAYGIAYSGGRDDKPEPKVRPEDVEKTRTPYGTQRQIGSGLYTVSAYIAHSCEPSTRPSFSSGTAELHIVANRDLKEGDEVTVAYVDVTQREDEDIAQARRRRRMELARGWRFACSCDRCVREGLGQAAVEDDVSVQGDGSKVEDTVRRAEERDAAGSDYSADPESHVD